VHLDAELLAHRLQQLQHRELGVEDVGDVAALGHLLEEAAAHRGLAGADFAGQQHEAAAAAHAVQQVGQRLAVALAHEQVARVGRDREWLALQTEMGRVHGRRILCGPPQPGFGPPPHDSCRPGSALAPTEPGTCRLRDLAAAGLRDLFA